MTAQISAHGSRVLRALDQRGCLTIEEVARWAHLLAQQEGAQWMSEPQGPALRNHEVSIELLALVDTGLVERKTWRDRWEEDFARTEENARGGPFVGDQDTRTKYKLTTDGVRACELLRSERISR